MEYAESFGDIEYDQYIHRAMEEKEEKICRDIEQAKIKAEQGRIAIVRQVAYNPGNYDIGFRTNCAHNLISFSTYCLFRDGVRRMYCNSCPTIILDSRFGGQDEYCIEESLYNEIKKIIG